MSKNVFIGGDPIEPKEQPVPAPEGKVDTGQLGLVDVEPPLEAYEQIKGVPYTSKYLGVDLWNDVTYNAVKEVDDYVLGEIRQRKLTPTADSYKEVMGKIEVFLQMSQNETENSKLERIHTYIKLRNKNKKIEEQNGKLLKNIENYILSEGMYGT